MAERSLCMHPRPCCAVGVTRLALAACSGLCAVSQIKDFLCVVPAVVCCACRVKTLALTMLCVVPAHRKRWRRRTQAMRPAQPRSAALSRWAAAAPAPAPSPWT